jgi:hypothetical protein
MITVLQSDDNPQLQEGRGGEHHSNRYQAMMQTGGEGKGYLLNRLIHLHPSNSLSGDVFIFLF